MPTNIMTRRSAEPMSEFNSDVMDEERPGELMPRAEPKDTMDEERQSFVGLPRFYPLMNERNEDAIGGLKKRYYGGCKNAAEKQE